MAQETKVCEISIHALSGMRGYKTLRLKGFRQLRSLNIFIDTGSAHNFMESDLVTRMEWKVDPCALLDANLADGNSLPITGM